MVPPKRSLFLHLSALSDAEYNSYVEALRDVFDDGELSGLSDEELETRTVAIPVVRAWMRGRFRDVHQVDKVPSRYPIRLNRVDFRIQVLQLFSVIFAKGDVGRPASSGIASVDVRPSWRRD